MTAQGRVCRKVIPEDVAYLDIQVDYIKCPRMSQKFSPSDRAEIIGTIRGTGEFVSVIVTDQFQIGQLQWAKLYQGPWLMVRYMKRFPAVNARNGGFLARIKENERGKG